MRRVLLTGAGGFVGRWIGEGLVRRGFDVHGLSSGGGHTLPAGVHWHRGDLLRPGVAGDVLSMVKPDVLVHAAWFTGHGQFWTSDLNYRWVAASLDLLAAFRASGGRRFVGVGSCAEYDWRHGFCSEGVTPLEPGHPYGVCKIAVQRMADAFCTSHGIESTWARIFYPFGSHEPRQRLVPSVILSLIGGLEAQCTAGTQVRDVLAVADCGDAIAALAVSSVCGAVNIGSGEPVALRDVALAIGRKLDAANRVRLGAIAMRPDDPPVLIPDVRRLHSEVGWRPRMSLDAGLDDAIAWWRSAEGAAAL